MENLGYICIIHVSRCLLRTYYIYILEIEKGKTQPLPPKHSSVRLEDDESHVTESMQLSVEGLPRVCEARVPL